MQVTAVNDNAFQIIFGLSKFSAQHLGHWPGVHMELVHANLKLRYCSTLSPINTGFVKDCV